MMNLIVGLAAGAVTLGCGTAWAQKSANQCAKEVGSVTGEEREKKMIDCLLAHVPKTKKEPAYVRYIGIQVNSAGGVEPRATFNNPNKESAIKYAVIDVSLFNAVGDPVQSTLGALKALKFTGPLTYDDDMRVVEWGPIAYNHSAACVRIDAVSIEFMNGRVAKYEGPSLPPILHANAKQDCRVKVR